MHGGVSGWGRLLALCAGAALVLLDYLIVGGMFIHQPAGGEAFIVALVGCAVAAVALRRRWLLFAAQNLVTALAVLRVAQMREPVDWKELVPIVLALGCGNILAWGSRALSDPAAAIAAAARLTPPFFPASNTPDNAWT